jgi:hypothetical protein
MRKDGFVFRCFAFAVKEENSILPLKYPPMGRIADRGKYKWQRKNKINN